MPRFACCLFALLLTLAGSPRLACAQLDFALDEGAIAEAVQPINVGPQWSGSLSAGLNGKSGNSQNLDMNFGMDLTRESEITETKLRANYFYASNAVATTTDRWFGEFRQERKFENPRLSWYYESTLEVDRFKAFDYRITLHSGLAYKWIDDELHKLQTRMGAGASREVGAVDSEWLPELQFGADWERKLSEQTRIYTNLDYFPNISDFSDYRLNFKTGLDFLVDAKHNVNLRLFALNRYDSTPPAGNKSNDIDYGLALVVGF